MGSLKPYVLVIYLFITTFTVAHPQLPCYFIFGDSLYDNGNNNNLVTQARANYPPYGVDFPDGPTGRFSNGRNIADVIAELLGFENSIPSYASVSSEDISSRREHISRGVNYASGAAGIREESGEHMGGRISLNKQLAHHAIIILQLIDLIGNESSALEHLNKCIYTVAMGNNDFINNYFLPQYYNTSSLYTPEDYAEILVQQYTQQLSKLYEFGARKMAVSGAAYVGCTPAMMARFETNVCIDEVNGAVVQFNARLTAALVELESKLPGAKFIYMEPPLGYSTDFSVTDKPCCKVSASVGEGQCAPDQVPCNERQNYVFWDAFHPTESISLVDGATIYATMYPFFASETKLALSSKGHLIDDA